MEVLPQYQNLLGSGWTPLELDEILQIIKDLPLKDALIYLSSILKIMDYTKEGYIRIKAAIKDKANLKTFAFVPDAKQANLLQKFENNSKYLIMKTLAPKYRYIDIIRSGLLIDYYHENDTKENREKVLEIKTNITKQPNGRKLLKILNLPTTPFFDTLLEYLLRLKEVGYSERNIEETFEDLVDSWEESTLMVKSTHKVETVYNFCNRKFEDKVPVFILCGMKSASKIIDKTMTKIIEEDLLNHYNYIWKRTEKSEGNKPRIELLFIQKS